MHVVIEDISADERLRFLCCWRWQLVEARLDELERAATELHRSHSSTESLLKQSEATVASLNAQVQDQKSEMQTLHAELEACADKRRAEAERATQAEVGRAPTGVERR